MPTQIGFHGTSKRHRASLRGGLKATTSTWDPNSGGELGQGFYIANNREGALFYGYGVTSTAIMGGSTNIDDQTVDLWKVMCSIPLDNLLHFAVSSSQTWSKFPKSYFENFHFVYLYNDPGLPRPLTPPRRANATELPQISQLKFSPNAFAIGMLTLEFDTEMPYQDALA